ncbi:uncharacterized protein LOC124921837 [Impatiens glandulifera]|uniref:uncharacterized protein LOC124921837 n=1 Tax=Impatiens glandulifera TaxID=253017 RepID=UPI001FB0BAFC|nr:uncharacterized protein LOC124921837 [Impatiens glandulifera]
MSLPATRKSKWHLAPPPPPTPRILNLPRRFRRRRTCRTAAAASSSSYGGRPVIVSGRDPDVKLEPLLDRERKFAENSIPVVAEEREINGGGGFVEEKWKFQAEILRAECNFLRMEREIALKKLERNRTQMEITLRSAVESLVSGRKKIYEGKSSLNEVLEEEIEYLEEMLGQLLQTGSYAAANDLKVKKCINFDKKAVLLRRRLESLGGCLLPDEKRSAVKENESASASASAASDEKSIRSVSEEEEKKKMSCSSGRCKSIVKRIVEQVRAETDQWSQMQEMVGRVRDEMEELQLCREFWEDRALDSEFETRSLRNMVEEWRQKAMSFEEKARDLETEASLLREKLKNKEEENHRPRVSGKRSVVVAPRLAFRDIGNSLSLKEVNQIKSSSRSGRDDTSFGFSS